MERMEPPNRIVLIPDVLAGRPIVRGTRLSVEFVVGLFGQDWSEQQVLENYPSLTHDDVVRLARRRVAAISIQDQWQGMFSVVEETRVGSVPLPAGSSRSWPRARRLGLELAGRAMNFLLPKVT